MVITRKTEGGRTDCLKDMQLIANVTWQCIMQVVYQPAGSEDKKDYRLQV